MCATVLAGCSAWKPTEIAPQATVTRNLPDPMRITLSDGRQVQLARPRIQADTLRAFDEARRRVAIPVTDITRIESRKTNTFALFLMGAGVIFVGLAGFSRAWDP